MCIRDSYTRSDSGGGVLDDRGAGRVDAEGVRGSQVDVRGGLAPGHLHAAEDLAVEDPVEADLAELQLDLRAVGAARAGHPAVEQLGDLVGRGHRAGDRLEVEHQGVVATAAELGDPLVGDREPSVGGDDADLVHEGPPDEQPEAVRRADRPSELVEHRAEDRVRDPLRVDEHPVTVEEHSVEGVIIHAADPIRRTPLTAVAAPTPRLASTVEIRAQNNREDQPARRRAGNPQAAPQTHGPGQPRQEDTRGPSSRAARARGWAKAGGGAGPGSGSGQAEPGQAKPGRAKPGPGPGRGRGRGRAGPGRGRAGPRPSRAEPG